MKVIIPILKRAIAKCERELNKLNEIICAQPLVEIVKIRQEAQVVLKNEVKPQAKLRAMKGLAEREKAQWVIAKKQENLQGLYDKKFALSEELKEYKGTLFYVEQNMDLRLLIR